MKKFTHLRSLAAGFAFLTMGLAVNAQQTNLTENLAIDSISASACSPWENPWDVTNGDVLDVSGVPVSSVGLGDNMAPADIYGYWGSNEAVGVWNWIQFNFGTPTQMGEGEVYYVWNKGEIPDGEWFQRPSLGDSVFVHCTGLVPPDSVYFSYYNEGTSSWVPIESTKGTWKSGIDTSHWCRYHFDPSVNPSNIRFNFRGDTMFVGLAEIQIFDVWDATDVKTIKLADPFITNYNSLTGRLYVQGTTDNLEAIKVVSVTGQVVFEKRNINALQYETTLTQKGVYVVILESRGKMFTKKIVTL